VKKCPQPVACSPSLDNVVDEHDLVVEAAEKTGRSVAGSQPRTERKFQGDDVIILKMFTAKKWRTPPLID
jgi:hypothetical protein